MSKLARAARPHPERTIVTTTPLLAAAGANGLLTGASLDQSIKQLPARHRIGVLAFARYSQTADLANGVAWYAVLGVGTALLALIAAGAGLAASRPPRSR
jgi:hypothetical protein